MVVRRCSLNVLRLSRSLVCSPCLFSDSGPSATALKPPPLLLLCLAACHFDLSLFGLHFSLSFPLVTFTFHVSLFGFPACQSGPCADDRTQPDTIRAVRRCFDRSRWCALVSH
jgi:hypothetical protein